VEVEDDLLVLPVGRLLLADGNLRLVERALEEVTAHLDVLALERPASERPPALAAELVGAVVEVGKVLAEDVGRPVD
jgi:hypothetical protein